jgi:hypothetical protein
MGCPAPAADEGIIGSDDPTAAMIVGDLVTYGGRACILRGFEPMSVPDRRAELEDAETGERLFAPVGDLEPAAEGFRADTP